MSDLEVPRWTIRCDRCGCDFNCLWMSNDGVWGSVEEARDDARHWHEWSNHKMAAGVEVDFADDQDARFVDDICPECAMKFKKEQERKAAETDQ